MSAAFSRKLIKPDEVFSIVEEMPSFSGGYSEFSKFISKNLKNPRRAQNANVEGKVIVRFVVDGDVSDVEVLKGLGFVTLMKK